MLGEGGMGWVWEAVHVATQERYALKFLKGGKDEDRRRFVREVRAAGAVQHPNVVIVHDFLDLADASLVIVMELLEGETLGALLRREKTLTLQAIAALLLPVVSALEAAHAVGVVHRDLKPDNIFLTRDLHGRVGVKVLDFGVAKLTAEGGLAARTQAITETGSMLGTPYYMSPEQVFSDKDLDARADLWSLGVVMYEALAGVRPTEAETVGRVLKRIMGAELDPLTKHCEVPADVASLVSRMLSVERGSRPGLSEVREVLARHAAPNRPTSMPPTRRRPRTPRLLALLGVPVALVSATLVVRQGRFGEARAPVEPVSSAATARTPSPMTVSLAAAALPAVDAGAVPSGERVVVTPASIAFTAPRANVVTERMRPNSPAPDAGARALAAASSAVVSALVCEAGDVASEGHCCPRGHVWQSGRCQRPLATSF
jgi:serine/threonine-protein kinase